MTKNKTFVCPSIVIHLKKVKEWEKSFSDSRFIEYKKAKRRLYNISLENLQGPFSIPKDFYFGLVIKTDSRSSVIIEDMVGLIFLVARGNSFDSRLICPDIVGYPLGAFVETRKNGYNKRKGKRKNKKR